MKQNKMDSITLLETLQNEEINKKVAQFHQLHCGRVCLIPFAAKNDIPEYEMFERQAFIDFLFNCCCVGDLQLKKMMLNEGACCC